MSNATVFSADRFTFVVVDGVDLTRPGIYEWEIEGVGIYIGKYKRISRPQRAYARSVANLLANRPYRKSRQDRFRGIHHALADAVRQKRNVKLTILENPPAWKINSRELELIAERGTLNRTGR
ncbi:MAG: hypothetical protein AB7P69_27505 [Candidatus Binatia bacterium]